MKRRGPPLPESPSPARHHQSIRGRLTKTIGASFTVAVVLAFAGVLLFISSSEQEIWEARQGEAAAGAAHTLDNFFYSVETYLSIVSQIKASYLLTYQGTLEGLLHQNEALIELVRLNNQDRVIASARITDSVLDNPFTIAQANWLASARSGHSYMGDLQISSSGQPYLILAMPAVDDGVLAARLNADVLWDVIANVRLGQTGAAYVVDARGNIIAHQNPEVVLARTSIADRPEMIAARASQDGQWHGDYRNFEGRNVRGFTARLPNSDWWIFTEISLTEAGALSRRAAFTLGAGLLVTGLTVIGITQFILRQQVFDPLERLRDGVERVGEGDLDYRVESVRPDEIGQVGATFNLMTGQLQERERALERARDEAQAASEFKSRLLANVSHEMRTPLNGILGYTDMLKDGVFGSLTREQATANDRILANTQRLLTLINNLLDQARIDAGKIELVYAPVDPTELLEETVNILGLLAVRKGIALNTAVAADLPTPIMTDRQRLQQIMMNLMTNAIKFTDWGTIDVRMECHDTDHWRIRVKDTGRGITPEEQGYIFESFRQVDSSLTREQSGVGLGLSIVKQLVTLMSGVIQLDSTPGEGSTFTVVLPLISPDAIREESSL